MENENTLFNLIHDFQNSQYMKTLVILSFLGLSFFLGYPRGSFSIQSSELALKAISLDTIPSDSVFSLDLSPGISLIVPLAFPWHLDTTVTMDTSQYIGLPAGTNMSTIIFVE